MSQVMRRMVAAMNCDGWRLLLYANPTRVRGGISFLLCRRQSSACSVSTTTRLEQHNSADLLATKCTAVISSQH